MSLIMVAGIGTDVGKTIASAVLVHLLQGDYWKPIQCGDENDSDSSKMKAWTDPTQHTIHPSSYSLNAPVSPHHAARLAHVTIDPSSIILPSTSRPLIIEGVGGVLVPLTTKISTLDLFAAWACSWVVVVRHYLGSINHTLLTLDVLKRRSVRILGLIFNGEPESDSESAILQFSNLPVLGRLLPETTFNTKTFQKYSELWTQNTFGTPLLKLRQLIPPFTSRAPQARIFTQQTEPDI
jgi:dethiobiotin synthetase